MDKLVMGLRPEWPSNNPSQGLVDELWEQTESCWNQKPDGRPTASKVLQTLQVLSGTQRRGTVASVEDSEDRAIVGEREQVEDSPDGTFWSGCSDSRSDARLIYSVFDTRRTRRTRQL